MSQINKQPETFMWNGQLRYKCPIIQESGDPCEWDFYSPQELREHMKHPHTYSGKPAPKPARVLSPILDSEGQKIVHEAPIPSAFEAISFASEKK